jgi:hypothetical protein
MPNAGTPAARKVASPGVSTTPSFSEPTLFDGNINDLTFGQAISAMPPRLMQVSLKFSF